MNLFRILSAVLIGGILVGGAVLSRQPQVAPYLVITETEYTDQTETDMVSNCILYDLDKGELVNKGTVSYTSVYPVTTFSTRKNAILYSAYSGNGDQLYEDAQGTPKQITNQFSGINSIAQCGSRIMLSARYLEKYCMEPIFVDPSQGTVTEIYPDAEDDRFTWLITCDPLSNRAFFAYYSDDLSREYDRIWNQEGHTLGDGAQPHTAPFLFCAVDVNTAEVTQIYTAPEYVWGMAVSGNTLYYASSASGISNRENYACYKVDLETKEKTKLSLPVHITGDMAVWNDVLYCVGWAQEDRGIYAIDLNTLQYTLIYTSENGFINGCSLNY